MSMGRKRSGGGRGTTGLAVLATAACAGCLSPAAPPPTRYYQPRCTPALEALGEPLPGRALRLSAVEAAPSVRERLVWALPSGEVGFYEYERWLEPPAVTLERWLGAAFFEARGFAERTFTASRPIAQPPDASERSAGAARAQALGAALADVAAAAVGHVEVLLAGGEGAP
jgi:hypothetical protein